MNQFDPNNRNQRSGTGFTNLSRIIGANQNNQLASTVGSGVSNQVNQAKTGIQSGISSFDQKANAAKIATDENKTKAQTLINDPTQATDEDAKSFETFRSGRYDGPKELENKQQLTNQANQASTLGSMAGSAEGRQGLLQRFVGGAGYTQGKQRLDSMLLGQGGNAGLKSSYRDARGLNQSLNAATISAEEQAKMIAAQNRGFADQTKNSLATGVNQIFDTGNTKMADWKKSQSDLINGITTAGAFDPNNSNGDVNLTQEQYNTLTDSGLDLSNPYLYNTSLGNVISKSAFNPTLNSALSQQEAARAQALSKLYGKDINEKGTSLLQNIKDPSQFGTLATAKKIDASDALRKQGIDDAQRGILETYFREGYEPYGMKASPAYGYNGPQYGGSAEEFANAVRDGKLNAGESPGGMSNLASSLINDKNAAASGVGDIMNTGGEYSTKGNMERYIDALRGSDKYWTGQGYVPHKSTDTIYDPTLEDVGMMSGIGAGKIADQFGRLRKIINPNASKISNAQIDPVTGKVIQQGPIVG